MKKQIVFLTFLGLLFSYSGCSAQQSQTLPYAQSFLVDVRTPQEFKEGTAMGAINIPLDVLEKRLGEFKSKKQIVVFCRSGSRSSQAYELLKRNGFQNVINGGTWQLVQQQLNSGK